MKKFEEMARMLAWRQYGRTYKDLSDEEAMLVSKEISSLLKEAEKSDETNTSS